MFIITKSVGRYNAKKGVSLLIALGLIGVITFFATIVANIVITQTRQAANSNRSNEAYFAAEGGLEMGLLENSKHGSGYSATLTPKNYGGGVSTAAVTIQGQVPVDVRYMSPSSYANMYGAPTPGTGNVGAGCDPLKALRSSPFNYDANTNTYTESTNGQFDAADHPCNWNKIKIGESVSIPLYTLDSNGAVVNPAEMNLQGLILRVRTPCSDGNEMCSAYVRYTLDETFGDLPCDFINGPSDGCGDTIISWSITGTNVDGDKSYELRPLAVPDYYYVNPLYKRKEYNSEIYEYLINRARTLTFDGFYGFNCSPFCVLNENRGGEDQYLPKGNPGTILQFLLNDASSPFNRTAGDKLNKPVLKFTVINSLRDFATQNPVPYLEYQLISDINSAYTPTDTSQTITSEGFSGEFKWTLEVKKPHGGGLLEYVIQQ